MYSIPRLPRYWITQAVFACAMLTALPAWAQEDGGNLGAEGGGPWVLPYALLILGVGLGLMMVLRPGKRRDRPQVDRWEEKDEE